jgi:hypothetical protein
MAARRSVVSGRNRQIVLVTASAITHNGGAQQTRGPSAFDRPDVTVANRPAAVRATPTGSRPCSLSPARNRRRTDSPPDGVGAPAAAMPQRIESPISRAKDDASRYNQTDPRRLRLALRRRLRRTRGADQGDLRNRPSRQRESPALGRKAKLILRASAAGGAGCSARNRMPGPSPYRPARDRRLGSGRYRPPPSLVPADNRARRFACH